MATLPALTKPVGVACSSCGTTYTYGKIGRFAFYDRAASNGTVIRAGRRGRGTPCCGAQAHQGGAWASTLASNLPTEPSGASHVDPAR